MKYGTYHGRLQNITEGRIQDLILTYNLACNPTHQPDEQLKVFKNNIHSKAKQKSKELSFLGTLDGIIIGIGGCDPANIAPEQITPEWAESAKTFFDPTKNIQTYFTRLIEIKKELLFRGIPAEKIDFMPKYPHHFYPSAINLFEDAKSRAFQYICAESDHHIQRINTKAPNERNIIVLYHDHRKQTKELKRKRERITNMKLPYQEFYNLPFLLSIDFQKKSINKKSLQKLDALLTLCKQNKRELVLTLNCMPRASDRQIYSEIQGQEYYQANPLHPFQKYFLLKKTLLKKGADLSKTHITFYPEGMETNNPRKNSFLPNRYIRI